MVSTVALRPPVTRAVVGNEEPELERVLRITPVTVGSVGDGKTRVRSESATPTVRERLRSGVLALLEESGTADLSVRRIAAASGRSTMSVYSTFGGIGPLLDTVYEDAAALLREGLGSEPEGAPVRYAAWAREHAGVYQVLFQHDLEALGIQPERRRRLIDACAAVLGDGEEGYRRWALAHGLVVLEGAGGAGAPRRGAVRGSAS